MQTPYIYNSVCGNSNLRVMKWFTFADAELKKKYLKKSLFKTLKEDKDKDNRSKKKIFCTKYFSI